MDLAISQNQNQKMDNTELQKVAALMFLKGAGRKDVIDFLSENGIENDNVEKMATDAYMLVKDQRKAIVDQQLGTQQAAAGGGTGGVLSIIIGLVLIIGGIAATMASDRIFYGAIGVGVVTLFQGLASRG